GGVGSGAVGGGREDGRRDGGRALVAAGRRRPGAHRGPLVARQSGPRRRRRPAALGVLPGGATPQVTIWIGDPAAGEVVLASRRRENFTTVRHPVPGTPV